MKLAIKNSAIRQLWLGQALSSIGDEIYRVGLVWLAVGILKTDSGFINAGQMATLMLVSFFGGKWVDHIDPITIMKRVDVARAILVLIPVIAYFFFPLNLVLLVTIAFAISGLNAFFDPSVQATLPILSNNADVLRDTNGLMSTTTRSARLIGPTIVSFLSGLIPTIHFFTLDSLTFILSAFSLIRLSKLIKYDPEKYRSKTKSTFWKSVKGGFDLAKKHREIKFILLAKALTSGTWNICFNLCFALLVHEKISGDVKAFGLLVAAYGLGNIIGAVIFGNQKRKNSIFNIFFGYFLLGFGFVGIGYFDDFQLILSSACFAGFMGPLNDLAFIELLQKRYTISELPKIFRLRQSSETLMALILFLISPFLLRILSVANLISFIGLSWILIGIIGSIFSFKVIEATE